MVSRKGTRNWSDVERESRESWPSVLANWDFVSLLHQLVTDILERWQQQVEQEQQEEQLWQQGC